MFCAAGLHLWGSIDGVVWAIILLNTAAIYLTYLLAVRTVGFPTALWAALLMATSPEAVKYSVLVFNPVVMSFLGTCLLLALWRGGAGGGSAGALLFFFFSFCVLALFFFWVGAGFPVLLAALWGI